ncbi:MAG: hypothetical protein NC483_07375 [Ruminococcus sp.]|nr:hypothetical protein [Ruminococcus sp.]
MKIEKLRNRSSKKCFLCGLISVVVLIVTVTFITSKANYRMTASIPLTEGKVTASPYDINIVALYLDNIEQDSNTIIPNGYRINESQSYCYKGTNKNNKDSNAKLYTDELGNHSFSGISKSSKCILYLDKINYEAKTMSELLNTHYKYKSKRTVENKDFNVPYGETTYGMIFEAEDDDGTTYYFAGNPLDNWVEFGGYYWRIIRINGDGSIRLIYSGTELNSTGSETDVGEMVFNEVVNDSKYLGYFYSTVYTTLNNWFKYKSGLIMEEYFNKIDLNAGFCGDRTPSSNYNIIDNTMGSVATFYGGYVRLRPNGTYVTLNSPTVTPTFKCSSGEDLYTYSGASQGNKILENPVGLISADEVSYAGLVINNSIKNSYIVTGQDYWTMTPYYFSDNASGYHNIASYIFIVLGSGNFGALSVNKPSAIKPVINLRSDVLFTGNGTISNPYKVVV